MEAAAARAGTSVGALRVRAHRAYRTLQIPGGELIVSNEHPVPRVHEEMVQRLIADARPTRPLGSPLARTVPWVVLEGVTMLLAIAVGLRHSVVEAFASRRLAYEVAGLLVVAAWLAWLALRATIQGRD